MTQTEHQRCPRPRRGSANKRRHCVEMMQQFVEVIGPDRFLHIIGCQQNVRSPGVAAVMQQHPVAMGGDLLGERNELVEPATTAGDQGDKRSVVTDHVVAQVHPADCGDRHGCFPSMDRRRQVVRLYAGLRKPKTA